MAAAHALRVIRDVLRNVFARERLDVAPLPATPERPRASLLKALLAAEPLPLDPEPPPRARRPGVLRALFGREVLSESPPESPRPARQRWLRWLFRPESLDPPP